MYLAYMLAIAGCSRQKWLWTLCERWHQAHENAAEQPIQMGSVMSSFNSLELDRLADVLADRIVARLALRLDVESLLDVHGAAELLNCSVPTIERLVSRGQLPSIKVGSLRRFKRGELLKHLSKNEKGTNDE